MLGLAEGFGLPAVLTNAFRSGPMKLLKVESRVELFSWIRRDARVEGLPIRDLARGHVAGRPAVQVGSRASRTTVLENAGVDGAAGWTYFERHRR